MSNYKDNRNSYLIYFEDNFNIGDTIIIQINQVFDDVEKLLNYIHQELKLKYYDKFPNKYCKFKILSISKLDDLLKHDLPELPEILLNNK